MLEPKGHGMGPSFSRITCSNKIDDKPFDACDTLRSVFKIDSSLECAVTKQMEDDISVTTRLEQRITGYKVFNTDVKVNVIKTSGDVIVSGEFYVKAPQPTEVLLTPQQAVTAARKALALRLSEVYESSDQNSFEPDSIEHNLEESELVYATPEGTIHVEDMKLCYKVRLVAKQEFHPADVLVDAATGEIVGFRDYKYTH